MDLPPISPEAAAPLRHNHDAVWDKPREMTRALSFVLPSDYKHCQSGLAASSRFFSAKPSKIQFSSYISLQEPVIQTLTAVGYYHGSPHTNIQHCDFPGGQEVAIFQSNDCDSRENILMQETEFVIR